MQATVERTHPQVSKESRHHWRNKHLTFQHPLEWMVNVKNPLDATSATAAGLQKTIGAFQSVMKEARDRGKRLRALGSGWSFSDVAATEGYLVDTKHLRWYFELSAASVSPQYRGVRERLRYTQCGIKVLNLNNELRKDGLALKTSGASNGQTIAGALSTGTHGSAIDFGGISEFVVGIHLIVGTDRHVYIERKSYPVVSQRFVDAIGATLMRDDDETFNAALVSLGSFGIICGLMLETAPLYLLQAERVQLPFDDKLKHTITTLDFSNLPGQPDPSTRPFHFEVVINPYDKQKRAYVTFMYKRPYRDDYPRIEEDHEGLGPGDDAPLFIGQLTDVLPAAIPAAMNRLIGVQYDVFPETWGTLGEIFTNTTTRGKAAGSALGVPLGQTLKAVEAALEVHKKHGPYGAIIALRYVKGSDALLSFTGHKPTTCIVDLDGVNSGRTVDHYERTWKAFEDAGIPFRMHWGKFNSFLTPARVRRMYGAANVDAWLAARRRLMPDAALRRAFTNDFIERAGLAG